MTLLVLVAIGAAGAAISAWGLGRGGRPAEVGAAVGWLSLIAVLVLALAMEAPRVDSGESAAGLAAFNGHLVPNDYLRLVVGLWALDAVLFVFIGWLIGGLEGLRGLMPATLAAIVGGTVAFGATDLALGSLAAGAVGLSALAVLLVGRDAVTAGARELRVAIAGTAVLVAVSAAAPATTTLLFEAIGPVTEGGLSPAAGTTEAAAMIGLFALAIALVVSVRLGAIPFHLRVPRLTDVAPPISLPLLLAWIPVPLGVAAIAIVDQQLAPLALPLDGEQTLIVGIALLTLVGGALAAFISDDIRHATGYLVIADGALVLLGFAALDPAAWGPTRVWLVAVAASKTAVLAWSAVMEDRFGTRAIPDLRGWLRHSPILGAGLTVAAVATYGLPGWVAFEARADLAELSGSGIAWLIALAGVATLPTYVRLLAIGTGPATSRVRGAAPERVRIPRRQETLPVALEGAGDAPDAAAVPGVVGAVVVAPAASPGTSSGSGSAGHSPTALARAGVARTRAEASAIEASLGRRAAAAMRRDRTELLAATVLALAVLAALTSWGALDIGGAASEAAPIVSGPSTD
jgi:NADH:ubiquinone oxidoreductase subunit 2 (subunit N)